MWLTWDQLDARVAWDYYPLCMSLVARVSSDVVDGTSQNSMTSNPDIYQGLHNLEQLSEFISFSTTATKPSSTSTTTPCTLSVSPRNSTPMTKKEIIEDLSQGGGHKYDLQVVLDTLYQLDNEDQES